MVVVVVVVVRDSEWQWHQLGHMQVCISLQHPTTQFFTGRMPFLPPNRQRQSTEGKYYYTSLTASFPEKPG